MKTRRKSKKGRTKVRQNQSRPVPRTPTKAPKFVVNVVSNFVPKEPELPPEPPRFVINTAPTETTVITKSKYADLSKSEKLQAFLDLACYVSEEEFGFVYIDVSHPDNRDKAEAWFKDNLMFLGRQDADELRRIWDCAIEDGGSARILFNAIKYLKEKYGDL